MQLPALGFPNALGWMALDISIFDTQVLRDSFQRGDERSGLKKGRFMSQLMLNGYLWGLKICSDVES